MNLSEIKEALSYDDILLVPCPSDLESTSQADISITLDKLPTPFKCSMPIINSPMDMVTSKELLVLLLERNIPITIHRYYKTPEEQLQFVESIYNDYLMSCTNRNVEPNPPSNIFVSIGSVLKWQKDIDYILSYRKISHFPFSILVDMANGDTKACIETVKYLRKNDEKMNIMAGNVATKGGFTRLQNAGANLIRCGIGGGASCSTRNQCSFGVPTLTSVMSCEERRENAYLIADGGIEHNADIIKAIRCGADLVMIGKKFAQTNLSNGLKLNESKEFTENEEEFAYCQYRGMSSFDARQASPCRKNASVEGVTGYVKYFGTTKKYLDAMNENLKTAITYYGGCVNWSQFRKMVKVIRISQAGMNESATRLIHF